MGRGAGARRCGLRTVGAADDPGFERGGAKQAAGDAREDQRDIGGAEVSRDDGEVRGGGVLLQRAGKFLAVVDELADEAEQAPGAAGCVAAGGRPILVGIGAVGWVGGGWRSGHERNKNTNGVG